jgi:tRNA A37 threonylcarbamoyladenosine biosynthesis protein TsaE
LEENIENEVIHLGISDIWKRPENVVIIEWAEKIKEMIPESAKWIKFENLGGENRKIIIQ